MNSPQPIFPYIETEQYLEFVDICEYVRRTRVMGMVYGGVGSGKTEAGRAFVAAQPLLAANGRPSTHRIHLRGSQKTDRILLNGIASSITGQPSHRVADDAMEEVMRLITKYRIDLLIIDEIGYLQESALEALRTLHDPGYGQRFIPILLITMNDVKYKLQYDPKFEKFYSRIGQFLAFRGPSKYQLKNDILPKATKESHIIFRSTQKDADEIIDTLFELAGGTEERGANFRDIVDILRQYQELFENARMARDSHDDPHESPPELPIFDKATLRIAAQYAKGIEPRTAGDRPKK